MSRAPGRRRTGNRAAIGFAVFRFQRALVVRPVAGLKASGRWLLKLLTGRRRGQNWDFP
ncbi:hypothetical protein MPC4_190084 [Methylocella tundrae]|uniref:Uncharacterized protein n=1 Tax=Methylocella tundrae TaxID=227605 RepID=A0A8B6M413_METTU|nr:hypothetical protein MPC1_7340003 [Methylocella tundrae]VTZ49771.1 hypothetical protein MPC4_190084 [Methylocella tundrae]